MKRKISLLFAVGMMAIAPLGLNAQKVDVRRNLVNTKKMGNVMIFEYEIIKDSNIACTNETVGKCSFERISMPMERITIDISKAKSITIEQAEYALLNPESPVKGNSGDQMDKPKDTRYYSGFMWLHNSGKQYDNSYYIYHPATYSIEPYILESKYSGFSWIILAGWIMIAIVIFLMVLLNDFIPEIAMGSAVVFLCLSILYQLYMWVQYNDINKPVVNYIILYIITAVIWLLRSSFDKEIHPTMEKVVSIVFSVTTYLSLILLSVGYQDYCRVVMILLLVLGISDIIAYLWSKYISYEYIKKNIQAKLKKFS